jgi:Haloacid dehalogenase-like hydrolase
VIAGPPGLFAGYALDLDGTVYVGDELLPGAAATVRGLRDRGARIVFVTNKPLASAAQYAENLTDLGIPTVAQDVVTAVDALVNYLSAHHHGRRLSSTPGFAPCVRTARRARPPSRTPTPSPTTCSPASINCSPQPDQGPRE